MHKFTGIALNEVGALDANAQELREWLEVWASIAEQSMRVQGDIYIPKTEKDSETLLHTKTTQLKRLKVDDLKTQGQAKGLAEAIANKDNMVKWRRSTSRR